MPSFALLNQNTTSTSGRHQEQDDRGISNN